MKLYLIGMPGAGKSTIGKLLSNRIGLKFLDTDRIIEDKYGSIKEIFKEFGENYFRDLETSILKDLMEEDNCIISCGGGIVLRDVNKKYMNGVVIYLYSNINDLIKRTNSCLDSRPLLNDKNMSSLFNERKDKYMAFKDIIVLNQDINTTLDTILEEIKYEKKNINN